MNKVPQKKTKSTKPKTPAVDQAFVAAAVVSMALTDGRKAKTGATTIATEAVRVAFALAAGRLNAAVAIADGIGLDIGVHEDDAVFVVGRTREVKLVDGFRMAVSQ